MSERRWQPPPMATSSEGDKAQATPKVTAPKVTVDEKVVRKMLQVNPDMRKGRTTLQVKKALESGAPASGTAAPVVAPDSNLGRELEDTVGFFLRGKADRAREMAVDIATRRRALDEEEARGKRELIDQVAGFVALLDAKTVEAHGAAALAKHHELLKALGLTPQQLLESVRRTRR